MAQDFEKRDLRIVKTEKALYDATHSLLDNNAFRKVTVRDICGEALVSRATFYSYYMDKYDLLRHWLSGVLTQNFATCYDYKGIKKAVSQFIPGYKNVLKNILEDADDETIGIVNNCLLIALDLPASPKTGEKYDMQYIVVSNLLAGGIMQYLLWHIKNRYPDEVMNIYLYDTVCNIMERYRHTQS